MFNIFNGEAGDRFLAASWMAFAADSGTHQLQAEHAQSLLDACRKFVLQPAPEGAARTSRGFRYLGLVCAQMSATRTARKTTRTHRSICVGVGTYAYMTHFGGLVLGCIEADFCKLYKLCLEIGNLFVNNFATSA